MIIIKTLVEVFMLYVLVELSFQFGVAYAMVKLGNPPIRGLKFNNLYVQLIYRIKLAMYDTIVRITE